MWTAFKNISKLTLLAFLLQWFYPFARLWLLVAGPLVYIGVVFALQWYTWYCHEQAELYGSGKKAVTKGNPSKTNRVLFSGPRASLAEMAYIGLSHTPMFLYMLFNVIVNRIIPFTWKYCQPGFRNTTITDKVIFDMITGSSLITIAKINETGDEISFRFPDDFDCKLVSGFNPAGLEIVLNIAEQRMERAEIKGEPLDKEYVMTSLIMASGMWIHTLIHLSSEKCAREIENKPSKLHEIKESSRFVTARVATLELVKQYKLDINPEYVFNNVVLHSVDHYAIAVIMANVDFPFGSYGLRSYITGHFFSHIWCPPTGSIFSDERISRSTKSFYQKLYQRCAALDKDLADNIYYSTSY